MKKLSKVDELRRNEIAKKIDEKYALLIDAIKDANKAIERLNEIRSDYNETINEAGGFVEDMVSVMDEYIDDRSENWPDTENGSLYIEWHDTYENFESTEIEEFPLIEEPDNEVSENLLNLPSSPE